MFTLKNLRVNWGNNSKNFFTEKDKERFKDFIATIDRTGHSQTDRIINNFANTLNKCILKIYNALPLSKCIIDEVNTTQS